MPEYDDKNIYHHKIMKLAKEATVKGTSKKLYEELEENYLNLCRTT